ncbi:MAG: hypothetical protein EOP07_25890 [Proteobacteria bacterium]|nr:MAG: hypothetical protein EOP07_25890 [Pseudomonadota bacterium]
MKNSIALTLALSASAIATQSFAESRTVACEKAGSISTLSMTNTDEGLTAALSVSLKTLRKQNGNSQILLANDGTQIDLNAAGATLLRLDLATKGCSVGFGGAICDSDRALLTWQDASETVKTVEIAASINWASGYNLISLKSIDSSDLNISGQVCEKSLSVSK